MQTKQNKQLQQYNTLCYWTHGLGQRWHRDMTDHSSISRVHPETLVICAASCHSTQLLAVSPLHLSFFSFCPTFSVLFIPLTKCAQLLKHSCHGFMEAEVENRVNKKEESRVLRLVRRRASSDTCHLFSFCFLERGVVIMCCVVYYDWEGQINQDSLFALVPSQGTMREAIHHFCP